MIELIIKILFEILIKSLNSTGKPEGPWNTCISPRKKIKKTAGIDKIKHKIKALTNSKSIPLYR